ncbi:MAG: hypothetical protein JO011_18330 [Ktedonobacteraceae bacterium]|nr:hypothetical protein [Ktedonobacteraceae bacterium]MBV9712862.1 hypothetical protein [Ktedonobacteraceae bacterium]
MNAKHLAILLILSSLLLIGCNAAPSASAPDPNKLHITREPMAFYPMAEQTETQINLVQKLYEHILSLPHLSTDQGCPDVAGTKYQLTFSRDKTIVLTATADSGGCQTVTLNSNDVRAADQQMWQQIKQILR